MNWFFITLGYSGTSKIAPGTVGSFVALLLGMWILLSLGVQTLFLATVLISLIAIKEINRYEANGGLHDNKHIVIDELSGMWFALCVAPAAGVGMDDVQNLSNGFIVQSLLSFAFFRYFDITKPSIIGRIDREAKGGVGVMGDDIIAGFAAGVVSALLWQGYLALGL